MSKSTGKVFSLWKKLALMILLGFGLMVVSYFSVNYVGGKIIEQYYLSDDASAQRYAGYEESFRAYVQEHGLSATDYGAIASWCPKDVYVIVYSGGQVFYASYWPEDEIEAYQGDVDAEGVTTFDAAASGNQFAVSFADAVYLVSVEDLSYGVLYSFVYYLSLLVGCALFLTALLIFNSKSTKKILRLSRDVNRISNGELNRAIDRGRGSDEINRLAEDVEGMRCYLLRQVENEQNALRSNSELITSLSHDLRTPLTTLIGYLDMAENGQYDSEEELHRYIDMSMKKARQLKEMSDEMFRYFLVFGKQQLDLKEEEFDAQVLLEQMLGEQIFLLQEEGYQVETSVLEEPCTIRVDATHLSRVFDNIFSNLRKYADPGTPIRIKAFRTTDILIAEVRNRIRGDAGEKESTKIGLATCRKIMEGMGGTFFAEGRKDTFCVRLTLPCTLPGDKALPEEK